MATATQTVATDIAFREQRVVSTNDSDFLRLVADGRPHAGIAYCLPEANSIGEVIRYLALMNDCLSPENVANRIEYL